jgi:site-specific DNA-methyltransferase (adenine-specific)
MSLVINDESLKHLKTIEDNYFDSVVTDPPYELGFMGKIWDSTGIAFTTELWKEVYRTLKPGGYLLSFAASRNYHRMAVAIEDSGFEIRDQIMWIYGSGFPKSLNIGKSIDKKQGNKRKVIGTANQQDIRSGNYVKGPKDRIDVPITKGDSEWEGWGTALKPAHEPICMARKQISEKSIVDNVLKHGTGGINIDGCRVGTEERTYDLKGGENLNKLSREGTGDSEDAKSLGAYGVGAKQKNIGKTTVKGRYPANLIHDGSEEVIDEFKKFGEDKSTGGGGKKTISKNLNVFKNKWGEITYPKDVGFGDVGTPARFFYSAKATKKERGDSKHPTVKPLSLMRYLVKLVTPKEGLVLDPFAGTGTTGEACILENRNYYLIEREKKYLKDIDNRLNKYGRLGI